jgi:hypothetical protein
MYKKVLIMDDTGRVVTIDEINLRGINYEAKDQEWFDLAWQNAVEDGLVDEHDRTKYKITFA